MIGSTSECGQQPTSTLSSRVGRRVRAAVALIAGALLAVALAAPAAGAEVVVDGQWQCRDRGVTLPIRGAKVELHTTGLFGGTVTTGFTDEEGNYHLSTHDGGDHFVRLVLRGAEGVHLNDSIVPWEWYTDSPTFNLGQGDNLVGADQISDGAGNTPVCAVWQGVHDSFLDFESAVGGPPPYGNDLLVRGNFWPTAGVPFTLDTTIQWPGGFPTGDTPGDFTVTRHEFGHTFRHAFDGGLPHFLNDVVTFDYTQNHTHCESTNPGFAFNEGWAEFWSGDTAPCHADNPRRIRTWRATSPPRSCACRCTATTPSRHGRRAAGLSGAIHSFEAYAERIYRCVPTHAGADPTPVTIDGLSRVSPRCSLPGREVDEHAPRALHHDPAPAPRAERDPEAPAVPRRGCDRRLP